MGGSLPEGVVTKDRPAPEKARCLDARALQPSMKDPKDQARRLLRFVCSLLLAYHAQGNPEFCKAGRSAGNAERLGGVCAETLGQLSQERVLVPRMSACTIYAPCARLPPPTAAAHARLTPAAQPQSRPWPGRPGVRRSLLPAPSCPEPSFVCLCAKKHRGGSPIPFRRRRFLILPPRKGI